MTIISSRWTKKEILYKLNSVTVKKLILALIVAVCRDFNLNAEARTFARS